MRVGARLLCDSPCLAGEKRRELVPPCIAHRARLAHEIGHALLSRLDRRQALGFPGFTVLLVPLRLLLLQLAGCRLPVLRASLLRLLPAQGLGLLLLGGLLGLGPGALRSGLFRDASLALLREQEPQHAQRGEECECQHGRLQGTAPAAPLVALEERVVADPEDACDDPQERPLAHGGQRLAATDPQVRGQRLAPSAALVTRRGRDERGGIRRRSVALDQHGDDLLVPAEGAKVLDLGVHPS